MMEIMSAKMMEENFNAFIVRQVLKQKRLILKNFPHPPVAVMERLNELFAIKPELSLTEDYTSTIVPP
jgi:hypothetical protein